MSGMNESLVVDAAVRLRETVRTRSWDQVAAAMTDLIRAVDGVEPSSRPDAPCKCLAYDPIENDHSEGEHASCGGYDSTTAGPCGGCDDCVSARVGKLLWQAAAVDR
jgi:hypothetical protein